MATPDAARSAGQSEGGRLWDVLMQLLFAIRRGGDGSELTFQVLVRDAPAAPAELVTLKAVCGPGDDAAPVLTIMLPDED